MLWRGLCSIATAWVAVSTSASAQFVSPPANLVTTGIPPIGVELVNKIAPYTTFRPSSIVAWHPNSSAMLLRTQNGESQQLHLLTAPGDKPVPITGLLNDVDGAWFDPNNGETILYRQDQDGDQRFRLFRFNLATKQIMPISSDLAVAGVPAWNHKGDRIVFTSANHASVSAAIKRAETTDIFVADLFKPERARRVATLVGVQWSDVRFSPDGTSLALIETVSADASSIWTIDIASGKKRRITTARNDRPAVFAGVRFSANGKSLYATSRRRGEVRRLVEIDLASGRQTVLTSHLNADVDEFSISVAARRIALITNEDGVSVLRFLDLENKKELPRPALLAGEISGLQWKNTAADDVGRNAGTVLGFQLASTKSPRDIFSYDVKTTKLTRWTNGAAVGLNPFDFVEPKRVMAKGADGLMTSGLLYLPDAKKFPGRRPVIVKMSDATTSQARHGFVGRENYLINEMGIAIFVSDGARLDRVLDWITTQTDLNVGKIVMMDEAGGCMVVNHSDSIPTNDTTPPVTKPRLSVTGNNGRQTPSGILSGTADQLTRQGKHDWSLVAPDEGRVFKKKSNRDFLFYVQIQFLAQMLLQR